MKKNKISFFALIIFLLVLLFLLCINVNAKNTNEDIISISNAQLINNSDRTILNITQEVLYLDNVYSSVFSENNTLRVIFEKNLSSVNDITLFPKIISGNPKIEVYEKDKNKIIARFTNLKSGQYNKIFLTNLKGFQDTFDLKIINGSIELDQVIDPPAVCSAGVCTVTFNITNTTWQLPVGLTNVTGWVVGAGGAGSRSTSAGGGGAGGDFRKSTLINVTGLTNLSIFVGLGGIASGATGGTGGFTSITTSNLSTLLLAGGGGGGTVAANGSRNGTSTTIGGQVTGGTGGAGGGGSGTAGCGGGGGAGGWYGNGGAGGATGANGGASSTGGGGGGGGASGTNGATCGGGGGVGIVAFGINGSGGATGNLSVGTNGSQGKNAVGAVGGVYGGGGGGDDTATTGGNGGNGSAVITYVDDSNFPIFSNYWDDNSTLVGSGVANFNVTVNSTNGTVFFELNDLNYSARNLTQNVYNVSVALTTGAYTYRWLSWGNGSLTQYNSTLNREYTVNASANSCTYGTGNWALNCSDNCNFSTSQTITGNNNVTIKGSGNLTFNSGGKWIFNGTSQYIFINSGCTLNINSGGGWNS